RNDGKKDSSIAELSTLKPIYVSSASPGSKIIYDYSAGQSIKITSEKNGKVESNEKFMMPNAYFDGFLGEYLLGALPLKAGYTAQFEIYNGNKKQNSITLIKQVIEDVLITNHGKPIPVYLVIVDIADIEILYSIDKNTKEILKSVYSFGDGRYFIKSRV
ncbi:MAG TPA: hypothetical protein VIT44_17580, partial [Cyclobacteriaceae bacterium]